jgi:site-specific DNA recombinase
MREKAEQGIYPSRPPLGYLNNKLERTIEIDQQKAPMARRMFELDACGQYSLFSLRAAIRDEFGIALGKGYLDRLLKNPFYEGHFRWDGKLYPGTHIPLISAELFERVQAVFRGHNKPKYHSHDFAYRGLLTCAYDNCTVTAEIKKAKYTYYHCTGGRGKCELPYFRESELGDKLNGPWVELTSLALLDSSDRFLSDWPELIPRTDLLIRICSRELNPFAAAIS